MTTVPDDTFEKMIAAHIELANQHGQTIDRGFVGAAVMHAAARYNAFVSSSLVTSGEGMAASREAHLDHYAKQYREFLEYHYDFYAANFAKFTGQS